MAWKESSIVKERTKFVLRLEGGERMSDLCREFGISRKTGYKIWNRFQELGLIGVFDEPRAPERIPHRTSKEAELRIIQLRNEHPTWGPKKLRAFLLRETPEVRWPAASTVGDILKRHGIPVRRRRRNRTASLYTADLTNAEKPNDLWCADFKGQFRLRNGALCYPLTITDRMSRFVISCVALEDIRTSGARAVFEAAFRQFGLPTAIRTDNGSPFASVRSLFGLTKLSAWWLRLGIAHERIEPGQPQQNGQHERMHLDLKRETTRPAGANFLQQQERFDRFVAIYNNERPHEALEMRAPGVVYVPSERPFAVPELDYPTHDLILEVRDARVVIGPSKRDYIYLSAALEGQPVGLREVEDRRWLVTYGIKDLGVFTVGKHE